MHHLPFFSLSYCWAKASAKFFQKIKPAIAVRAQIVSPSISRTSLVMPSTFTYPLYGGFSPEIIVRTADMPYAIKFGPGSLLSYILCTCWMERGISKSACFNTQTAAIHRSLANTKAELSRPIRIRKLCNLIT